MQTSVISQKGQVVIPKQIRDKLELKEGDVLKFTIAKGKILIERAPTTEEMFGFIKTLRKPSKTSIKNAIKEKIAKKFLRK